MQRIAKSMLFAALILGVWAPGAFAADFISTFNADVFSNSSENTVDTQAGSTPYDGVTDFTISNTAGITSEQVKDIRVDLPSGLISNPEATPQCTQAKFTANSCDPKTQIGTVDLQALVVPVNGTPVYNLVPTDGHVSDFGFATAGGLLPPTHIIGGVRDTGD